MWLHIYSAGRREMTMSSSNEISVAFGLSKILIHRTWHAHGKPKPISLTCTCISTGCCTGSRLACHFFSRSPHHLSYVKVYHCSTETLTGCLLQDLLFLRPFSTVAKPARDDVTAWSRTQRQVYRPGGQVPHQDHQDPGDYDQCK